MTSDNSQSFKYEAALVGKTADAVDNRNTSVKHTKIVVPLKYLSNFWRSLEMTLINCKIILELNLIEDRVVSSAGDSEKFKITDTKLHVPVFTLSTNDRANLTKIYWFKSSIYWINYQAIHAKVIDQGSNINELLNVSFEGVKRLFVLAYTITAGAANNESGTNDNKKCFLLRRKGRKL